MKDDLVFVRHILDEIDYLTAAAGKVTFAEFTGSETLKRAVVRSLEVIGEAVKNLSPAFREQNSQISWRELAGLRDKLIHHYFGVNCGIVWDVVKNLIPGLKVQLEKLANTK